MIPNPLVSLAVLRLLGAVFCVAPAHAQSCLVPGNSRETDHFFFEGRLHAGASGDVVPLEIRATIDPYDGRWFGVTVVGCFDNASLELVGDPIYSEFFESVSGVRGFYELGGEFGPRREDGGAGFVFGANVLEQAYSSRASFGQSIPLATLYFRLLAADGVDVSVEICDQRFAYAGGSCLSNELAYEVAGPPGSTTIVTTSTRHIPAEIRVLPGPATRPEPPDLPPAAIVYPEAPAPGDLDIRFALAGAVVTPGSRDVPLDLSITSSHEFAGLTTSLRYPSEFLRLTRVDEHVRPGVLVIDNDAGHLALALFDSSRRVGREGERVRVATLFFDVSESATGAGALSIRFAPYTDRDQRSYENWIAIRHLGGTAGRLPVTAEVEPVYVAHGALRVQDEPTWRGDANFDGALDLSDALAILGELFLAAEPVACPAAADFDADGRRNVSDVVGILAVLFRGHPAPAAPSIFCDGAQSGAR